MAISGYSHQRCTGETNAADGRCNIRQFRLIRRQRFESRRESRASRCFPGRGIDKKRNTGLFGTGVPGLDLNFRADVCFTLPKGF
jgi:hypothetical protein